MSVSLGQPQESAPEYGASEPHGQDVPVEPARLGPLSRLSGTLLSPGETFEDVNRKPTFIAPMIVAILTVIVGYFCFSWRVHPDWDQVIRTQIKKQVERSGQTLTEEQMQQRVEFGKTISKFVPVIAVVSSPIIFVIVAGIFALGLIFVQAKTTFKKILSVVSWSWAATGVVATVVTMASLMIKDEEGLRNIDPTQPATVAPTSLAAFLPDLPAALKSIAGSLDVFTIWYLILLAIGFAAIAGSRKIKTGKTAVVVFGLWGLMVLLKAGWTAMVGG